MGILLRKDYILEAVRTHNINTEINDDGKSLIEYEITTPSKEKIWLLNTYLQKRTKDHDESDSIRKNQIFKITEVYNNLISQGKSNVIIAGTFNAPSYCNSLSPISKNTDLKDITKHLSFEVDMDKGDDANYFRLGAYRKGVNIKQKDFMFLSPALFDKMTNSGLNRKAIWTNKRPQWSTYRSVTNKSTEASEHPLVWGGEFI
ncbi:endonuclease/exonuclease/phosphatase [Algibacter lectus]|uniref:Endonuclease/exonuclease/phosphatase n=2 Tax=Algibacter lectus TaxID=221126 RepID=A0A090WXY0_9FLAO|nr:endonuclease/exonuclease/phosphatase [Algibacter lectus]